MSHGTGHDNSHAEHHEHGNPLLTLVKIVAWFVFIFPIFNQLVTAWSIWEIFSAQWLINTYVNFLQRWAILWLFLPCAQALIAFVQGNKKVDIYDPQAFIPILLKSVLGVYLGWVSLCIANTTEVIIFAVIVGYPVISKKFSWQKSPNKAKAILGGAVFLVVFGIFFVKGDSWFQQTIGVTSQEDDGKLHWDSFDCNYLPKDYSQVDEVIALDVVKYIQKGGSDTSGYINTHRYPNQDQPGYHRLEFGHSFWWFPQPQNGSEDPTSYLVVANMNGDSYMDVVVIQPGYDRNRGRIGFFLAQGGESGFPGEKSRAGGFRPGEPQGVLYGQNNGSRLGERWRLTSHGIIEVTQFVVGQNLEVNQIDWAGGFLKNSKPGPGKNVSVWKGAVQTGLTGIPRLTELTVLNLDQIRKPEGLYNALINTHPSQYYEFGEYNEGRFGPYTRVYFRHSSSEAWSQPLTIPQAGIEMTVKSRYLYSWKLGCLKGKCIGVYPQSRWLGHAEVENHQYAGDE